jgi:hypothetical protein
MDEQLLGSMAEKRSRNWRRRRKRERERDREKRKPKLVEAWEKRTGGGRRRKLEQRRRRRRTAPGRSGCRTVSIPDAYRPEYRLCITR